MTDEWSIDVPEDDDNLYDLRVDWDVREIAAVVVLVAVGIVILGGLATGITAAAGARTGAPGQLVAGEAMEFAAEWAEPLLAIVLLGVLGLCWWQMDEWFEVFDVNGDPAAASHVRRDRQIALWVCGTLVTTFVGSAALLAGIVLADSSFGSQLVWSRDIYYAASTLAVAVVASGGIWAWTRLSVKSKVGATGAAS